MSSPTPSRDLPGGEARALEASTSTDAINFAWLLRVRWWAIVGQLGAMLVVAPWLGVKLPWAPLLVIVGVEVIANLVGHLLSRRWVPIPGGLVAAGLAFDVVALTVLLYFTGGPFNPFSFLYLVHVALAAVVLPVRWTWGIVLLSLAGLAALFVDHVWLDLAPRDGGHMGLHLRGMWVAVAVGSIFIVHFVGRIRSALDAREAQLAEARVRAERAERVAALSTLAAGAAHELATPLGTIAVVTKELMRELSARETPDPSIMEDMLLVRDEVDRCREILDRLSAEAGRPRADEPAQDVNIPALVRETVGELPGGERVDVRAAGAEGSCRGAGLPPKALAMALRALIDNALDASPPEARVEVRVGPAPRGVAIEIADRGPGMPPEVQARVGEPFFTTKDVGKGMGLGVFLAQSVVQRLGGELAFESNAGAGTVVRVTIPCERIPSASQPPQAAAP